MNSETHRFDWDSSTEGSFIGPLLSIDIMVEHTFTTDVDEAHNDELGWTLVCFEIRRNPKSDEALKRVELANQQRHHDRDLMNILNWILKIPLEMILHLTTLYTTTNQFEPRVINPDFADFQAKLTAWMTELKVNHPNVDISE